MTATAYSRFSLVEPIDVGIRLDDNWEERDFHKKLQSPAV